MSFFYIVFFFFFFLMIILIQSLVPYTTELKIYFLGLSEPWWLTLVTSSGYQRGGQKCTSSSVLHFWHAWPYNLNRTPPRLSSGSRFIQNITRPFMEVHPLPHLCQIQSEKSLDMVKVIIVDCVMRGNSLFFLIALYDKSSAVTDAYLQCRLIVPRCNLLRKGHIKLPSASLSVRPSDLNNCKSYLRLMDRRWRIQ